MLTATDGTVEALLCYHDPHEPDDPRPSWWFDVASAMSWLSVACLALTLLAHVLLPELRDLQGRCHMGAVASLGLGLFMLAFLQAVNMDEPLCTITGTWRAGWMHTVAVLGGQAAAAAACELVEWRTVVTAGCSKHRLDVTLLLVAAFLAYYWLLSAFFWLNITSFNVWRSVV